MDKENIETRTRLLETAVTVFAEHGFAATTIRMISERARANVAAINYHFGGKEGLYREVLRYARRAAYEKYPTTYGLSLNASPEERLHAYLLSFLLRTIGTDSNPGFGVLLMREMVEPTSALDMMVEENIRSLFEQLVGIVQEILGRGAGIEHVRACARSTMSQALFYLFSRSVINRMDPERKFDLDNIESIAGQITRFTLSALKGLSQEQTGHDLRLPSGKEVN